MRHLMVSASAIALLAIPRVVVAQLPTTKPTTTATMTRLPSPAPVVAAQQADGTILVHWRPLPGAAKYQVTRSVPPAAAGVVAYPTDTTYVDNNVQAGSAYYYVIAGVDSSGGIGLKAGTSPVMAKSSATATSPAPSLINTGGTSGGGGGTSGGTAAPTLAAPTAIWADDWASPGVTVYWQFAQSGLAYRVERAISVAGSKTGLTWRTITTTAPRPCCFWSVQDSVAPLPRGETYAYRVSAVDPANLGTTSPPIVVIDPNVQGIGTTKWNFSQLQWRLIGTPVSDQTVTVGTRLGSGMNVVVSDSAVLGMDATRTLVAKAPGVSYYFSLRSGSASMPLLNGVRITVIP